MFGDSDIQIAALVVFVGTITSIPSIIEAGHRINTRMWENTFSSSDFNIEPEEKIDYVARGNTTRAIMFGVAAAIPTWHRIIEPYNALAAMFVAPTVGYLSWRVFRAIRW